MGRAWALSLSIFGLLAFVCAGAMGSNHGLRLDAGMSRGCPDPSALIRPKNPRGAIPAAKDALGVPGRVIEVKRGPHSTYAAAAKRECGVEVLRKSIYVNVHPIGYQCSACNLHAYVVKFRGGPWEVWTAY